MTEQEEEEANENGVVEQLQTDPFLAAVHDGKTYGILKRRDCGKLCCVSCSSLQMSCTHVAKYKEWCEDRGVDSNNVFADSSEANFESVSKSPVPYPWTKEMREQFGRYESHTDNFPLNLVPDLPAEGCEHGHDWDPRDPVTQQWTQHVGVCIYTRYANINYYPAPDGQRLPRVVYYRPTVGDCGCRHHYDGAADLLHNIDNRKMIYYGLLVDHLHSMVEGRQPLRTTQRVCNRTRATCGPLNEFQEVHWETFRQGWNTWARRLDIDWKKIFTCDHCGPEPSTIICDGTAIGFRKDFLEHQPSPAATEDLPVVTGSRHSERVFIDCAKSRRLLLRYSGKVSSGKSSGKSEISEAEMKDLQDKLDRCGRSDVTTVLRRLEEEGHTTRAPSTYSSFLKQLAMSTPVSGMTQIAWDDVAQRIVKRVAEGKVDLTDSSCHKYLGHLQKRAPVLADFVCSVTVAGRIPSDVSPVLLSLMAVLHETFEAVEVPASFPDPTPESPHSSFFPAYSLVCGLPRFAMNEARKRKETDSCRKESYGHPSLTPGLFTLFCPHGVCFGFEVMRSCESPQHPFEIIRTRFKTAPRTIVYDNACQLHRYVMNRDPHFFKKTQFLVDRFHWKGHVGCSLGYCMDSYSASVDIRTINSQVNEQANSGLARMKSQLSYMKPPNFMFHASLFLAVRNMDARRKTPDH
ncbi:uncharacterized protein [Branchiostoma lanceolatum]|uniref:uncharacterized protein n=1 Tax=Branchiostoma lanceolatum TaxID=7740 RepID=UPI003454A759